MYTVPIHEFLYQIKMLIMHFEWVGLVSEGKAANAASKYATGRVIVKTNVQFLLHTK